MKSEKQIKETIKVKKDFIAAYEHIIKTHKGEDTSISKDHVRELINANKMCIEELEEVLSDENVIRDNSIGSMELEAINSPFSISNSILGGEGEGKAQCNIQYYELIKRLRTHRCGNKVHIVCLPSLESHFDVERALRRVNKAFNLNSEKNYNNFIKENDKIQVVRDFKKFVEGFN